jgi:hypothetical protein
METYVFFVRKLAVGALLNVNSTMTICVISVQNPVGIALNLAFSWQQ